LQAARTLTAKAVAVNTNFCIPLVKFLLDAGDPGRSVRTTEWGRSFRLRMQFWFMFAGD
jgi:hypothetical protein